MAGMEEDTEATLSQQGQYASQIGSTSEETCTATEQPSALVSPRTEVHTDLHRYPRELRSCCHQTVPINFYTRAPSLFRNPSTAGTCVSPANGVLEGPIRLDEPLTAAHRHQVAAAAQPPLRLLRPVCQGRHWHPVIILFVRIERRVKSGARRPRLHHSPPDGVVHIGARATADASNGVVESNAALAWGRCGRRRRWCRGISVSRCGWGARRWYGGRGGSGRRGDSRHPPLIWWQALGQQPSSLLLGAPKRALDCLTKHHGRVGFAVVDVISKGWAVHVMTNSVADSVADRRSEQELLFQRFGLLPLRRNRDGRRFASSTQLCRTTSVRMAPTELWTGPSSSRGEMQVSARNTCRCRRRRGLLFVVHLFIEVVGRHRGSVGWSAPRQGDVLFASRQSGTCCSRGRNGRPSSRTLVHWDSGSPGTVWTRENESIGVRDDEVDVDARVGAATPWAASSSTPSLAHWRGRGLPGAHDPFSGPADATRPVSRTPSAAVLRKPALPASAHASALLGVHGRFIRLAAASHRASCAPPAVGCICVRFHDCGRL